MVEKHNQRGFTRIDALVAGVACLVLVLLASVLLGRPRERSIRTVCAANLAQIGKTMFVYANDYEGVLPRAGGRNTMWGQTMNWTATKRYEAFNLTAFGEGGRATISSCFYLLVKYYEAPTRLFLCRGDKGTIEFKLSEAGPLPRPDFGLSDAWDFGPPMLAYRSCSFSYHFPFSTYALETSRDPNLAVAADRNPWIKSPAGDVVSLVDFKPDIPPYGGTPEQARHGNAYAHALDGQNVLFLDGRATFETRAYCGVGKDNIYMISTAIAEGSPLGIMPSPSNSTASNRRDSVLVHDPDTIQTIPPGRR
jgi:hypothetical protein